MKEFTKAVGSGGTGHPKTYTIEEMKQYANQRVIDELEELQPKEIQQKSLTHQWKVIGQRALIRLSILKELKK